MTRMIIVQRHGHEIRFPPVLNATETPYTYRAFTSGDWYEELFLEHIRRLGRSGVYVDAGAHLGTHTAWFAALCPSTHVHAVEPVSRFADQVDRVVQANGLERKVTVHRVGLSDEPGRATNHLSPEHQVGFDPPGAAAARVESFTVTTLDELVDGPVAVIKLDVEGMEARALSGATRLLSADRPVIYAEALDRAQLRRISQVLRNVGYGPSGRIFNSSHTYEFVPSTGSLRVTAKARRAARAARIAPERVAHLVTRTAALGRPGHRSS
jgi:FkbM family methyltransferase